MKKSKHIKNLEYGIKIIWLVILLVALAQISFAQNALNMSYGNIEIERSCHPEGTIDYDAMRLKMIEGYRGIGVSKEGNINIFHSEHDDQ